MKLHEPVLLAVAVPSGFGPPSDTVTEAPFGAVPLTVTVPSALTTPLPITGAAGAALAARLPPIRRRRRMLRSFLRGRVGGDKPVGSRD